MLLRLGAAAVLVVRVVVVVLLGVALRRGRGQRVGAERRGHHVLIGGFGPGERLWSGVLRLLLLMLLVQRQLTGRLQVMGGVSCGNGAEGDAVMHACGFDRREEELCWLLMQLLRVCWLRVSRLRLLCVRRSRQ